MTAVASTTTEDKALFVDLSNAINRLSVNFNKVIYSRSNVKALRMLSQLTVGEMKTIGSDCVRS